MGLDELPIDVDSHPLRHRRGERLVGLALTRLPPELAGHAQPAADGAASVARDPLDRALPLAARNPPQRLENSLHPDLPIRHLQRPPWAPESAGLGRPGADLDK